MISFNQVCKRYPGGYDALKNVTFEIAEGEMVYLTGHSGAGKSTLLRIIAGVETDFVGELAFSKGYTVGLLEEEPHLDAQKTVKQVIQEAVQPILDLLHEYEQINNQFRQRREALEF